MYPINLIALIIGIVFIVSRLPAVIWPKRTVIICNKVLNNLYFLRGLGIVLLGSACYILYILFKNSNILEISMSWQNIIVGIILIFIVSVDAYLVTRRKRILGEI